MGSEDSAQVSHSPFHPLAHLQHADNHHNNHAAPSPPSKRDLTSWWKQFKRNTKKDGEPAPRPSGIFGVPLNVSIKYANVAISLTGDDGQSFIYGYVPIVVAKCGVFLKEKATDVEGIFRLSGSAKRIKDLQEAFDSPDRFGKGLDWTGYTVHDAANILRRYLNQLPEPIVPLDFYERFRDPLRNHQVQAVGDHESQAEDIGDFDHDKAVATYQELIKQLPALNRQLLLYILDLLTVFASKSEQNRMTSANLAAIFQPGMLSHPSHDMAPQEYRLSQDVLIFLIENQDNFLFGMTGTAADEQTVKDLQNAAHARTNSRSNLRRSASNASGGADSLRKYGNLRRNVSVSSKHSKNSSGTNPATPSSIGGASLGIHRSNTVPSKKPAGLSPGPFSRPEPSSPTPAGLSPSVHSWRASRSPSRTPPPRDTPNNPGFSLPPGANNPGLGVVNDPTQQPSPSDMHNFLGAPSPAVSTPPKERKLASLFIRQNSSETERKEVRQPNRLKKRRPIPGSASESAQSSTHSLHTGTGSEDPSLTPHQPTSAGIPSLVTDQSDVSTPKVSNTTSNPADDTPQAQWGGKVAPNISTDNNTLKPEGTRTPSLHSHSSVTDQSDMDDAVRAERKHNRRSWRFHRESKRTEESLPLSVSPPPPPIGSNAGAGFSNSSFASSNMPKKSNTNESMHPGTEASANGCQSSSITLPSQESDISYSAQASTLSLQKEGSSDAEKKGFFGNFKAKVAQVKEGVKERKAEKEKEKERTRSPPHSDNEKTSSRNSLSFLTSKEGRAARGGSVDITQDQHHHQHHQQHPPAANSATASDQQGLSEGTPTAPTAPGPVATAPIAPVSAASNPPPAIPEETTTEAEAEAQAEAGAKETAGTTAPVTSTDAAKTPAAEGAATAEAMTNPGEAATSLPGVKEEEVVVPPPSAPSTVDNATAAAAATAEPAAEPTSAPAVVPAPEELPKPAAGA